MTRQTAKVLEALLGAPSSDHYGWQLCKATDLQSGSLYPILARLEDADLLESGWDVSQVSRRGPRRRYYRFTSEGAQAARHLLAEYRVSVSGTHAPRLRPIGGVAG